MTDPITGGISAVEVATLTKFAKVKAILVKYGPYAAGLIVGFVLAKIL